MRRAAQATRQVGTAAEESSKRGSRAFDEFGKKGEVSLGEIRRGVKETTIGLLELSNQAGATTGKVGGLLSGLVAGFAGGGVIGLGIAGVSAGIALLGARSEEARK